MSGHTSGLGKGLAIIFAWVLGIIAAAGLIGFGLGALSDNVVIKAALAALLPMGAAYLFYQTRFVCLVCAGCGLISAAVGSYTAAAIASPLLAFIAAAVAAILAFLVPLLVILTIFSKVDSQSWRHPT